MSSSAADRPGRRCALAAALLAAAAALAPAAADPAPRHGISVFGELRYPPGFKHFAYADPAAPKGGSLKVAGIGSFETVNPFIQKGTKEILANRLLFDTLMTRAYDEEDALYGLVARTAELPEDGGWVAFNIDPAARFHDGSPVTADDIVFTFGLLRTKGHPIFRTVFRGVARAEATSRRRVRFVFAPGRHRDLPTALAGLPALSKAYYQRHEFDRTTFDAPLASGPYRIDRVDPGRSVVYRRVRDYWARDLPVNRGRHNFDTISAEYYRDRDVAFQAFFTRQYDFREEFTSRNWATQYGKPPVRKGLVVRESVADDLPSGVQRFVLNLRRGKFRDIRVREALDLAFDFEWTNRTLFHGLYRRTNSMFENSAMAAREAPSGAELALLAPHRGRVPDEVFTQPFRSPVTDGSGNTRRHLRRAARLLREAGHSVRDGVLRNPAGEPLAIEFLLAERTFDRIVNPYIAKLRVLGIAAAIRVVDDANFKRRVDSSDFDVIVHRLVQPLTPGVEQYDRFGSAAAGVAGSGNIGGIRNPVVDALIGRMVAATSRERLVTAVRALDRVLMWNRYVVTQWYNDRHNIAYWNKFGRPAVTPRFDPAIGVFDTWWQDDGKAALVARGDAPAPPPGALPPP